MNSANAYSLSALLLVMLGGALGAVARYLVALWATPLVALWGWPLATLLVNWLGSLLLGLTLGLVGRELCPESWRLGLGVGFLGAFTTFSTFSTEVEQLFNQQMNKALLYVTLSVLGGVILAYLGKILSLRF